MRLRLATFNLENLDDAPDLDPPLEARIAVLRPQLLRLDADVLCLQEIHGQRGPDKGPRRLLALDRLLEGTAYAGYHRVSTTSTGDHGDEPWVADLHNLVVLSRFPVAESHEVKAELVAVPTYRLTTAEPPAAEAEACAWDRPLLHVTLTLPNGHPLHVINLHLRAPTAAHVPGQKAGAFAWRSTAAWAEGYFLAGIKRTAQALEARLLVDRLLDAEPEALIAVMGDCNAEERETPLRILMCETADTGNGALAARSLVPLERSLPRDRRFSVIHKGRPVMLDHILVSRQLLGHFRRFEIHNETLSDETDPATHVEYATESYHAPLVAEFALP
ncbi:endonuclease/exonuclease/phosphatase family protein [Benzoatithermus flavus]|uniref:Endonuclease/exonuclease/phosphatase family protein n=1 Tax=Benzoatithermus flavus TaxID=3108223 RepID=A0ABU8XSR6_9PROT